MNQSHLARAFSTPRRVTAEHYVCMRDVMPPTHHTRAANTESFQLEPDASKQACTLVRIGATHWQFLAQTGQEHQALVQKVREHIDTELHSALDADLKQQDAREAVAA